MYITSAGCKAPITVVFYIHLLFISQNFAHWIFVNLSKFRLKCIRLQQNKYRYYCMSYEFGFGGLDKVR